MFRIVFISYNEPEADKNWADLKNRFPSAVRIHGVKGIHNAHKQAAERLDTYLQSMLSITNNQTQQIKNGHFWVVDGDSIISNDFNFEPPDEIWPNAVYVYRAQNPVNGLSYGYGGIKLLPIKETANMELDNIDMTTAISKNFFVVDQVASITNFNTDPFNAWKSAFRECVKLSSKIINGQIDAETEKRLDTWCNVYTDDTIPNVVWTLEGARDGRVYGANNKDNPKALKLINDFKWLQDQFANSYS